MDVGIAFPVVGLLAGAAFGLLAADLAHAAFAASVVCASASVVTLLTRAQPRWMFATTLGLSFASGEAALVIHAWREAWRPPLRVAFEYAAAGQDHVLAIVTGVLVADAALHEGGVSLKVDVGTVEIRGRGSGREERPLPPGAPRPARGGVLISVAGELAPTTADAWRAGRTLRLPVRLRRATRYLNVGLPDEERALARRGVILVGSVKSAALVEVVARGSPPEEIAAAIRAYIRRAIATHIGRHNPTASAIVTAILIGDRAGLSPAVERSLQDAGTYHVIAISGSNIAILAAVTLAAFRWAGVLGPAAMLTAVCGFITYGGIVEGGASVTRAVVMAVFYFLARSIDHRVAPIQGLAVAAGVLVVIDPLAIADAGFLLSFGATAAIVLVAPAIARLSWPKPMIAAVSLLLASAAAELALLPVSAFIFGRLTLAGLALNFVAIPAMAVTQMSGMMVVLIAPLSSTVADAVGRVAALSASALVDSAAVGWVPWLSWRVPRPSTWVLAAYYSGCLLILAPRRRCAVTAGMAVTCGAAIWIACDPPGIVASFGDGRLHVTFLDVGQGDATLVRFPRGTSMLVDAGGSGSGGYDVGDRVVGPVLRELRVRRLSTLVLTHGDVDHAGGALSIIREFRPFDTWEGVPVPRSPLLTVLRDLAAARNVRWTSVQRDDRMVIDGVEVWVHHPQPPDWERQNPRNDDSVVIELRWRAVSIVLSGDIERATEDAIGARFDSVGLRVLKVPHHGSRSSSSEPFLQQLRPQIAIVSAGRGNPFGHPVPEIVQRYEAIGAEMFRTDRDGAVTVETDGAGLSVHTYAGRRMSWPPR